MLICHAWRICLTLCQFVPWSVSSCRGVGLLCRSSVCCACRWRVWGNCQAGALPPARQAVLPLQPGAPTRQMLSRPACRSALSHFHSCASACMYLLPVAEHTVVRKSLPPDFYLSIAPLTVTRLSIEMKPCALPLHWGKHSTHATNYIVWLSTCNC